MSKEYANAITFAVLAAVLIFSAAPVLANEDSEGSAVNAATGLAVNAGVRVGAQADAEASEAVDASAEADSETEIESQDDSKAAVRARIGLGIGAVVKERYEKAREKYIEARENAKEGLDEFNSIKARLRLAASVDKSRIRAELKATARHVLLNQVNAIINHLDAIEDKQVAPDNYAEVRAFFEAKQQLLVDTNLSQEALISTSAEIRDYWRTHRLGVEKDVGEKLIARFDAIIANAEKFSARVAAQIAELKVDGKDTSLLERGLAKLNADIALFKDVSAKVEADLNASSDVNSEITIREAHQLLARMHKQLQVDFRLMKSLFNATRELDASAELSSKLTSELNQAIAESETTVRGDVNE